MSEENYAAELADELRRQASDETRTLTEWSVNAKRLMNRAADVLRPLELPEPFSHEEWCGAFLPAYYAKRTKFTGSLRPAVAAGLNAILAARKARQP